MVVWLDAHISPVIARWLRESFGVDAITLRELGLRDAEDAEIFSRARAAGAAVVTKDSDFVALLARHGAPPQIVWITCGNTTNAFLIKIMTEAWPLAETLLHAGEPLIEIGGRTD